MHPNVKKRGDCEACVCPCEEHREHNHDEAGNKLKPKEDCPHLSEIKFVDSDKNKCAACDEAEHLRVCTSCGEVNCCESSRGHDTEHFKKTGHPIIKPVHADYDFTWCYKCNAYVKPTADK